MSQKQKQEGSSTEAALTPKQLRHASRPKTGFENFVEPMMALYAQKTDELLITGLDPSAVLDELGTYKDLVAEEAQLKAQLQAVQALRRTHGSSIWDKVLNVYARAQSAARYDASIAPLIEGFVRFMRAGRKRAAEPPVS